MQEKQQLKEECEELRKQEAIYKYTQDVSLKTENRYKQEIETLKRHLSSSQEGRDYERELWDETQEKVRAREQVGGEKGSKHRYLQKRRSKKKIIQDTGKVNVNVEETNK